MIGDPGVPGLRVREDPGALWVTFDRPEARNALTIAMRRGLIDLIRAADADPGTRVVVLTGTDPAFSAGVDLKEALDGAPRGARTDPAAVLRAARTPVIAVVNGACYTGALELTLSCAFAVASERARFADTHAAVGLLAGWGMSALLPRAVGVRLARQMMLTGEPIDAEQALRAGLVTEVVPHERLIGRAEEIVARLLAADPAVVDTTLELLDTGDGATLAHALALEDAAKLRRRSAVTGGTDVADVARRFARTTG